IPSVVCLPAEVRQRSPRWPGLRCGAPRFGAVTSLIDQEWLRISRDSCRDSCRERFIHGIGESGHRRILSIDCNVASRIRGRTPARTIMTTIDPDPRHADSLTRGMVVEERLGNMEKSASLPDLFDPSSKGIEICGVRRVVTEVFCGDDLLEFETTSPTAVGIASTDYDGEEHAYFD